jgi:threonyl-tRNA synthetase
MLVIGPKDKDQGGVSLRDRIEGDLGFMTVAAALDKLQQERDERAIRQTVKRNFTGFASGGEEQAGDEY